MTPPHLEDRHALGGPITLAVGILAVPTAIALLYAMARVARALHGRVPFLAERPGVAGVLVWLGVASAIALALTAWRRRRAVRQSDLDESEPLEQPTDDPEPVATEKWGLATRLEGAIYLGAAWLIMYPAGLNPLSRAIGAGDATNALWLHWKFADLIKSGNLVPWHIPDAVYPFGLDQRLSDSHLPVIIGTLWNLVASPILAHNLAIFTALVLNFLAARHLARLFTHQPIPVMLSALAFGTAPAIALRLNGHYNLVFAFVLPLLVAEAVRVARGDTMVRPVRLGLLLFLAYLTGIYYFTFGAIAAVTIMLTARAARHDWLRRAGRVGAAAALALVLMSPFIYWRVQFEMAERAGGGVVVLSDDAVTYSADGLSVIAQPVTSTIDLPGSAVLRSGFRTNVLEATIFPGFLLLLGLAATIAWRSTLRVPLVAAAFVTWLFTLGPTLAVAGTTVFYSRVGAAVGWLPYQILLALPGAGSLRTPNRASHTLAAVLAACLALALATRWGTWSRLQRMAAASVCSALLITNLQIPINTSSLETGPDEQALLQEVKALAGPYDVAVNVPTDCTRRVGITSVWQMFHTLPFIGCQGNTASLPLFSQMDPYMTEQMASLRCYPSGFSRRGGLTYSSTFPVLPDHIAQLRDEFGVRFLLVDKVTLSGECREGRMNPATDALRTWYEVIGETDELLVIDVTRGPISSSDPEEGWTDFVEVAYAVILGRSPSEDELETSVSTLALGSDRRTVFDDIRSTVEFQVSACASAETQPLPQLSATWYEQAFVWLAFHALLDRDPGYPTVTDMATALRDGASHESVLDTLRNSEEYWSRWCT